MGEDTTQLQDIRAGFTFGVMLVPDRSCTGNKAALHVAQFRLVPIVVFCRYRFDDLEQDGASPRACQHLP